jgi:hypothetical protein
MKYPVEREREQGRYGGISPCFQGNLSFMYKFICRIPILELGRAGIYTILSDMMGGRVYGNMHPLYYTRSVATQLSGRKKERNVLVSMLAWYRRICSFTGYSSHTVRNIFWKPWLVYKMVNTVDRQCPAITIVSF